MRAAIAVLAIFVAGSIAFLVGLAIGFEDADARPAVGYAAERGCQVTHPSKKSYRKVDRMLRHHYPLRQIQRRRSKHYAVCVATREKSRAVFDFIQRSYKWRKQYAHKWPIKFNSLPAAWQNWAVATSSCESGMNPSTATGNGYYGGFQFLPSTWWAAGGTGMPNQHSWHYQAWIAVHWRMRSSQAQWPNCAPW